MTTYVDLNYTLSSALGRPHDDLVAPHKVNYYWFPEVELVNKPKEDAEYTRLALVLDEFFSNYDYNNENGWKFLNRHMAQQAYDVLKETTLEVINADKGGFENCIRKQWPSSNGGTSIVEVVLFAKGP